MSQFHTIYEPSTAPIRGLASSKIASLIPPGSGAYAMIQNLRWGDNGVLTVKSGGTKSTPTIDLDAIDATGVVPRGFTNIPIGINPTFSFAGFKGKTNNKTGVFFTTNMATWTELTYHQGKHGDTRLLADGSDDYETTFQVVYDRLDKSYCIVMQNGYDFPRVTNAFAKGGAAKHEPIVPPTRSNNWGATLTWKSYVIVNDFNNITFDNSGDQFDLINSDTAVVGNNTIRWRHDNTDVPTGSATINFLQCNNDLNPPTGSGAIQLDASDCRQLAIVIKPHEGEAGVSHFLQNYKISVKAGSSPARTIIDPLNTAKGATVVPADLSSRTYVVAGSLDDVPEAELSLIDQIVIEPTESAIKSPKDYKLDILCIAATGNIPGNVSYAITYCNHDSKAESYEQVLATRPERIQALGTVNLNNLRLPNAELLYYKTWISFQNTTETEMKKGVDRLRIYRKQHSSDPNADERSFTYVGEAAVAQYVNLSPDPDDPFDTDAPDGAWDFTQGTDELELRGTPDNLAPEDRKLWLTSPGAFQETIPISRCMAQAGNRLVCGARISQAGDAFPRLCASGAGMPFRFSSLSFDQDDISAPFEQEVTGENVQGFAVAAGASLGTNVVYVFTDQAVWMLNLMAVGTPTLLSREMSVGTDAPFTIAERHGRVYFLDTDRQVRLIAGDHYVPQGAVDPQGASGEMPISLSRGVVDDLLRAIPDERVRNARGLWFNNRYYLFYSRPSMGGDTANTYNSQCLVFSEHANAWESRDVFDSSMQVECPLSWRKLSTGYLAMSLPKLKALTLDNKVLELEQPGQPLHPGATPISIVLQTGDLHNSLWSGLHVKGMGLVADDQNGKTLTGEVTYKPTSAASSFSMSLDSTNPYQWSIQRSQSGAANGIAASVEFSGDVLGEKRLLALKMEVEPREMLAPKAG